MNIKKLLTMLMVPLLLPGFSAVAQNGNVRGTVTDAKTGSPLPGVTVAVKGTSSGTITNAEGIFDLQAPGTADTLIVSYIGYITQEVPIRSGPMRIAMELSKASLNEVVVIGYGTQQQKDITGSIATVNAKNFQKGAITSPDQLIAGKISGVSVTSNGGQPGGGSTIRIRGLASLNGNNDPLIVIDGVPLQSTDNGTLNQTISGVANPLSLINPDDIASITVLKDAASAAIYGSRASSGVILITTKKGITQKPKFDFSTQLSVSKLIKEVPVLSASQFRAYVKETGTPAQIALMGNASTNWQDQIYQTALTTNNNLSVSGAVKNMPYRVSVGYLGQQGILKTDNLKRTTATISLNPVFLNGHLNVSLNVTGALSQSRFANQGAIGSAVSFDPTQPVLKQGSPYGGYWEWLTGSGTLAPLATRNPLALLEQYHSLSHSNRSFGDLKLDYSIPMLPDLHITWNLGYDASQGKGTVMVPPDAAQQWNSNPPNHGYNTQYLQKTWNTTSEVSLNYNKDIKSIKSNINAVAGYGYYNNLMTHYNYAAFDSKGDTIPGSAPTYKFDKPENTLISYYGRLIYTYNDKYILMGSLRTDGSSRFAPNDRWGVFPAASLGWRINEEDFLKNSNTVSNLKLRASYGVTGNQEGIGYYNYLPDYYLSTVNSEYQFGNKFYSMYTPSAFNAGLTWEQTASTDVGIDYGFLNGRITGSIDYYYKKTKNLLDNITIPVGVNFTNILLTNIGNMTSKGFEFSLNLIPVQAKDVTWNVEFNMAYNKSTITRLRTVNNSTFEGDPTGRISGGTGNNIQIQSVGYSPNSFFVYKQIYDPKSGKPIEGLYEDINRDGVINSNDEYRYKSPFPPFVYGFSTSVNYKKWTFSTVLRANVGNYMYNNVEANLGVERGVLNPIGILDNATTNIYATGFFNNQYFSDYYIQNASFLKMDNIGVMYGLLTGNKLNLTLSANCQNVFTITKYQGINPEIYGGIDNTLYPVPRIYTLGVNVGF